jgi:hypothetical protein
MQIGAVRSSMDTSPGSRLFVSSLYQTKDQAEKEEAANMIEDIIET